MSPAHSKPILCPKCGELTTWTDNPFRPFCSERCKMIDLGAWADEKYAIPTSDSPSTDGDDGNEG